MASSECKIRKLLVANRAEIACRIFRTAERLGIATVAVFSAPDAHSLHVRSAGQSFPLEGAEAKDTYLSIDKILQAAKASGADAIHPGYGFLSENAEFAEAVVKQGLTFVGPSPSAMRKLGNKIAAKEVAKTAAAPTAPARIFEGKDLADEDLVVREIAAFGSTTGFPILIKAASGGGGRGMREIASAAEIPEAVRSAAREAGSAFGDATIFAEKIIRPARHIEVQIAGDKHGFVKALGDRDCTWQRRRQKIIEEAPAPGLDGATRAKMHKVAEDLGKAVGYDNLGTVEFLLDASGSFYFLEVNSRLQVEHPVTELVTGLDLVALQLHLAEGLPLSEFLGTNPESGKKYAHAIEARICAEVTDAAGTRISTGRFARLRLPEERDDGPARVRVDSGYAQGDSMSHYYDSLVAKIIVGASTRNECRAALMASIGDMEIAGVHTNAAIVEALVTVPSFVSLHHAVDLFDKSPELIEGVEKYRAAAGILYVLGSEKFKRPEGFEFANNRRSLRFVTVDSIPYRLEIRFAPGTGEITAEAIPAGAKSTRLEIPFYSADMPIRLLVDGQVLDGVRARLFLLDRSTWVPVRGVPVRVDPHTVRSGSGEQKASSGDIVTALPGKVVRIHKTANQDVGPGEPLLVIESMKMEHPFSAAGTGKVKGVLVTEGQTVEAGALLMRVMYTDA